MIGQIIKGIGGFYYIYNDGKIFELKAKGSFRKIGKKPIVGDFVEFENNNGFIENILPRENEFYRPTVSNMTMACIVISASLPQPDLLLLDKLLIQCEIAKIKAIIVINKCDEAPYGFVESIKKQYHFYKVIECSAKEHYGIDEIKNCLFKNTTFMCGQSGVGKSSIINKLFPQLNFQVGDISKKLERGKHTTRHVEIVKIEDIKGAIVDTPGFSLYEFKKFDINIQDFYPEFIKFSKCKFPSCSHINEPNCKIKEQLDIEINIERYNRYKTIYNEIKEMEKKRYD